jgi:hypothetical protein
MPGAMTLRPAVQTLAWKHHGPHSNEAGVNTAIRQQCLVCSLLYHSPLIPAPQYNRLRVLLADDGQ